MGRTMAQLVRRKTHMQNKSVKSLELRGLITETLAANYLGSLWELNAVDVLVKLRCNALKGGKHIQPFAKF